MSALGMSRAELFENLLNGRSAIRRMEEWGLNLNGGFSPGAPVVLGDAAKKKIPRLFRRSMGDLSIFASLAAMQALEESGLEPEAVSGGRCGCVIGSTMGSSKSIAEAFRMILLEHGMADMPAAQFFKCASHTASFNVANLLNITGCVQSASAACASGLQAVGTARSLIAYGAQDIMICGGADELSQEVTGSFDLLMRERRNMKMPRNVLPVRSMRGEQDWSAVKVRESSFWRSMNMQGSAARKSLRRSPVMPRADAVRRSASPMRLRSGAV